MQTRIILTALMLLFIMNGCTKYIFPLSVNPLYTQNDLVYDPKLPGTWIVDGPGEVTTFCIKEDDDTSYVAVINDSSGVKRGGLELHLMQLDNHLFLDMFPKEPEGVSGFYAMHLLPFHSMFKIHKMNEDTLLISSFNLGWLNDMIEENAIDIGYENIDKYEGIFFTASTEELQRFVLEHIDVAFSLTYKTSATDILFYRQK